MLGYLTDLLRFQASFPNGESIAGFCLLEATLERVTASAPFRLRGSYRQDDDKGHQRRIICERALGVQFASPRARGSESKFMANRNVFICNSVLSQPHCIRVMLEMSFEKCRME